MATEESSAEQRLYDAASRWSDAPGYDPKDLIDSAVQALVDGLDSPSLRELAGASPSDRSDEVQPLLDATLDELNIPRPGGIDPWQRVWTGGRIVPVCRRSRFGSRLLPPGMSLVTSCWSLSTTSR